MSREFILACADAEAAACAQGFDGLAHAFGVLRLAESHGISCADAEAHIADMTQFAREQAQAETREWAVRVEMLREIEARKEPPQ